MDAPKVLAKGRNLLAEEIKEQARWAGVPILENAPLAQSLYRSVEAGQSIPVELYAAVASILAFLYRQRVEQEMRQRREQAAGARGGVPQGATGRGPTQPGGPGSGSATGLIPGSIGPRGQNSRRNRTGSDSEDDPNATPESKRQPRPK